MVAPLRHRQTKEAETDMFDLQPPRHISTLHTASNRCGAKVRTRSGQSGHAESVGLNPAYGRQIFFWTPGAMNGSTTVQSSQANSGLCRRVHPVIVGWFDVAVGVDAGTIPRGPWPHIHV